MCPYFHTIVFNWARRSPYCRPDEPRFQLILDRHKKSRVGPSCDAGHGDVGDVGGRPSEDLHLHRAGAPTRLLTLIPGVRPSNRRRAWSTVSWTCVARRRYGPCAPGTFSPPFVVANLSLELSLTSHFSFLTFSDQPAICLMLLFRTEVRRRVDDVGSPALGVYEHPHDPRAGLRPEEEIELSGSRIERPGWTRLPRSGSVRTPRQ